MTLILEVDVDALQVLPETDAIGASDVQLDCGWFTFNCGYTRCNNTCC